jgi:hypothetical protein
MGSYYRGSTILIFIQNKLNLMASVKMREMGFEVIRGSETFQCFKKKFAEHNYYTYFRLFPINAFIYRAFKLEFVVNFHSLLYFHVHRKQLSLPLTITVHTHILCYNIII